MSSLQTVNQSRSLAIIPARGNSERIKHKNIVSLGGIPLIAHSINAIRKADCFCRIIVSTDSPDIAEVAVAFGAEVPFLRTPETAGPNANLIDVFSEVLDNLVHLEGFAPDILGIFLPTAPFRRPSKIREICSRVLEGASAGNLLRPIQLNLGNLFYRDRQGAIRRCPEQEEHSVRPLYLQNIISVAIDRLDWNVLSSMGVSPSTRGYYRHHVSWVSHQTFSCLDADDLEKCPHPNTRYLYVAYASYEEAVDINTHDDLRMAEEVCRTWNQC